MNLEEYFSRLQKKAKQQKDDSDRTRRESSSSQVDTSHIQQFLDEGKRDFN